MLPPVLLFQGRKDDSAVRNGRKVSLLLHTYLGSVPAGFEIGIKTMKVGGRRRLVVPPELGPPTGPSTFFSAKQCEVSPTAGSSPLLLRSTLTAPAAVLPCP